MSEGTSDNIDSLIQLFSSIEINTDMEALVEQVKKLQENIETINGQIANLDKTPKVEEYKEVAVNAVDANNVSLEMFKSLPEFNGDRNKYMAWRNSATNVIKIFGDVTNTQKYFEALNIIRNKITGSASEALTNYNTVFNFDAIISRLDFTYSDKRPIHIIEQEMIVLQQKSMSVEDFYDEVNKKLNVLINKVNMTYKDKNIARAMVQNASDKALRTFITGLKGDLANILYASYPSTMPEAYAKLQTIVNDQERIKFANQFNQQSTSVQLNSGAEPYKINPNFKVRDKNPFKFVRREFNKPEPMEIDRSSMRVNFDKNEKRPRSQQTSGNRQKFQRINILTGDDGAGPSKSQDEQPLLSNDELDDTHNNSDGGESADETSSIFLDN